MNESEFIAALRQLPLHAGARGLEDDCAVLEFGSETLILTHDMMAEGTHFRADADMADVAWKLVAANLSDLAAKGAEPIGVLLGYGLNANDEGFLSGLKAALDAFGTRLIGGDTISAQGARAFGLTAIGRATHTPVPSRAGANVGDEIFVTGTLGLAMRGFEGDADYLAPFNRPQPRLNEGYRLAPHVTAMMDISDGLLLDAFRMATASSKTFVLEQCLVPVTEPNRIAECIRWGDDYELLFTAPQGVKLPVPATRIGEVIGNCSWPLTWNGEPISNPDNLGYSHG